MLVSSLFGHRMISETPGVFIFRKVKVKVKGQMFVFSHLDVGRSRKRPGAFIFRKVIGVKDQMFVSFLFGRRTITESPWRVHFSKGQGKCHWGQRSVNTGKTLHRYLDVGRHHN